MCGIAGVSLARNDFIAIPATIRSLLTGIEPRGRDATGIAYVNGEGRTWIYKGAVRAQTFNAYVTADHLPDLPSARTVIAHTRWATQGAPAVYENNHPVTNNGLVGVHNGHISNDDAIFARIGLDRLGQVDSEAAIALISTAKNRPWDVLPELRGTAALAWIDSDAPEFLHLARVSASPLVIAQTRRGSLVFASTRTAVLATLDEVGRKPVYVEDVPEGTYMRARAGIIDTVQRFEVPASFRSRNLPNYSRQSALSSKGF